MSTVFQDIETIKSFPPYKILALFGKSGAGKDTVQKWLVSNFSNMKGIVSCTTRPKREHEHDGIDYHFIDNIEFTKKVLDGTMLEATSFRDWFYGTPFDELDYNLINVGVFNIHGIECLLEDSRLSVLPVMIDAPDKTRLKRNLSREKNPDCEEICRRFLADEKDFSDIPFDYEIFMNYDEQRGFFNVQNIPKVAEFIKDDIH